MNEILNNNFEISFPKIAETLKNSSFIAIDCEFSGIEYKNVPELTLFDSMQDRYRKQKRNIEHYTAVQIGLTAFTRVKHENKYIAEPFNFYLVSRALFDDEVIQWEKSAFNFLKCHKFDWNKLAYEGISFMNNQEIERFKEQLKINSYSSNMKAFATLEGENKFWQSIHEVSAWLKDSAIDDKSMEIPCDDYVQLCYLQRQLRKSYKRIWTEQKDKSIIVIKVDSELRKFLEEKDDLIDTQLLSYCMGFTRIFNVLCDIKKPIVGHNLFLDLMFIYKQFYRNLPNNYDKFKGEIHELFPIIYDTKFLSYEMKKIIGKKTWKSNYLEELYQFFKSGEGSHLAGNSPRIQFPDGTITDEEKYHDAGWDSYYSGYCFVKIAHIFAIKQRGGCPELQDLTNTELMSSLRDLVNRVNIIRADVSYIRLDGPDPPSTRPSWLNIETLTSKSIGIDEISMALSSFGSLNIKSYSSKSVLVATANFRTAREILEHFQKSKDFQATPFSPWRHSPVVRSIFWGTLVVSGSVLALLIHQTIQKPSPV